MNINASNTGTDNGPVSYTSRPTNTSVLYCIATKNIYIDARHNYSLEEQEVGTWIDGKTLYEKTIVVDLSTTTQPTADRTFTNLATITQDYDKCFLIGGFYEYIITGDYRTLPIFGGNTNTTSYYYTTIRKNDSGVWFINLLNEGTTWVRAILGTNCNAYFVINYTKTTD